MHDETMSAMCRTYMRRPPENGGDMPSAKRALHEQKQLAEQNVGHTLTAATQFALMLDNATQSTLPKWLQKESG
jgi:hypothetical protein